MGNASHKPTRLAVVADYLEEGWPSMDLVADMLADGLRGVGGAGSAGPALLSAVELIRPAMRRHFSRVGQSLGGFHNLDRLLARFHGYAAELRRLRGGFELFHVVDHSYAHLVHALPPGRAVVTCHDLDAFRCLWEPVKSRLGPVLRAMARRTLSGMQRAAHVCCDSDATRDELLARGLLPTERATVVRLGLRPEFLLPPDLAAEARVDGLLGKVVPTADFLHVGSTIPRKRIDVLLEVLARLRAKTGLRLRLLRVGGRFTPEQQARVERLGLQDHVLVLPFLSPLELASVYRRAALVLVPSEAEGFGLPVVEGLACATPVLASDLPVLREVGGDTASYAPVADVDAWVAQAGALLAERRDSPVLWEARRERCHRQGARFSWAETARQTLEIYRRVLSGKT